jgi:hypothetical protein
MRLTCIQKFNIRMKDLSVSNDFFYHSLVKNDITKVPLTLDNVITILPHVSDLINSKYEVYIKNGIKTAWNILKCFNDVTIFVILAYRISKDYGW